MLLLLQWALSWWQHEQCQLWETWLYLLHLQLPAPMGSSRQPNQPFQQQRMLHQLLQNKHLSLVLQPLYLPLFFQVSSKPFMTRKTFCSVLICSFPPSVCSLGSHQSSARQSNMLGCKPQWLRHKHVFLSADFIRGAVNSGQPTRWTAKAGRQLCKLMS